VGMATGLVLGFFGPKNFFVCFGLSKGQTTEREPLVSMPRKAKGPNKPDKSEGSDLKCEKGHDVIMRTDGQGRLVEECPTCKTRKTLTKY
jgi:hypothetical protein